MDDGLHIRGAGGVPGIGRTEGTAPPQGNECQGPADFETWLKEAQAKRVNFSNHAKERIERRQIALTEDELSLLSEGLDRAGEKGSRESLLLMDGNAFVVNVATRTVITALGAEQMKERLFTNIDSALVLS